MKKLISRLVLAAALCSLPNFIQPARAQGTMFTYQGRLIAGASPTSGNYDFTFALFNTNNTNSGQVGITLTNLDVGVTNGLFTVTLDFGAVFTGLPTWLSISVRTNGGSNFTALNPLQEVTPAPYAIYAPNAGAAASAVSVAAGAIVGPIAATNLPPSVITNGQNGVNLTGTFTGNGAGSTGLNGAGLLAGSVGAPQLAAGTLAAPVTVAATNINATGNASYVATNASLTTIYLPTNANLGTVVQITGQGTGGWTAQFTNPYWTLTSAPQADWNAVACSSNGAQLVAVDGGGTGIWTSSNSGTNWTEQTSAPISADWQSVASSSDGTHLVAAESPGGIWTSSNSGTNWTEQTTAPTNADWISVASSSDGTHLVAVPFAGGIYTSVNYGQNWKEQTTAPIDAAWNGVASSSDGTHLVAVVSTGEGAGIWTSSNSGTNWSQQTTPPGAYYWSSVASSSDGTHLVAAQYQGGLWTSPNSGVDWTEQMSVSTNADWDCVASSSDGTHLAAVQEPGGIWTSTNSGVDWTEQMSGSTNEYWDSVASSSDGARLVAVVDGGGIYDNYNPVVTVATGTQGTTTALQYLGNGVWQAAGPSGTKWNATAVLNAAGPLPVSNSFTSSGGTLAIFASGSGYTRTNAGPSIGMNVNLDGAQIGQCRLVADLLSTHLAFVRSTLVQAGIAPGAHTLTLSPISGTITDFDDFFVVTVLELPF